MTLFLLILLSPATALMNQPTSAGGGSVGLWRMDLTVGVGASDNILPRRSPCLSLVPRQCAVMRQGPAAGRHAQAWHHSSWPSWSTRLWTPMAWVRELMGFSPCLGHAMNLVHLLLLLLLSGTLPDLEVCTAATRVVRPALWAPCHRRRGAR